jgi:hypothetical protein
MAVAKKRTVHRSAITGKFVKNEYAKRNPKTTVAETVPVRKKRK